MTEPREPVLALVGQPNCGKSTLFNALAGFRAHTANFPGTTVQRLESAAMAAGRRFRIVDLPGTYSLSAHDPAEEVAREYLLSGDVDAVLVVLDASILTRGLELVVQILEMGVPAAVALNMMDEAERKGVKVDVEALKARLGVAVVPTIATRGQGVADAVAEALKAAEGRLRGRLPRYDRDVEEAVEEILARLPAGLAGGRITPRFAALRLLEADPAFERRAAGLDPAFAEFVRERRRRLAELHGWPEETVLASHRHAFTMDLAEEVAKVSSRGRVTAAERLDRIVLHPVLGFAVAGLLLLSLLALSFWIGGSLAAVLGRPFEQLIDLIGPRALEHPGWAVLKGLVEGVAGGAGIVLPYLVPLLLILSFLEDVGYLPRLAYLLDGLLHRMGLHGKSAVPLILGYGCTVPALMGARILENPRDRLVVSLLAPLIPCSARTVVILALAGALLGPAWALGIYAGGLLLTGLAGRILARFLPGEDIGLLMEVPPYRAPFLSLLARKTALRLWDFLARAWPVLIAGSVFMGLLEYAGADRVLNGLLSPLTQGLLGLPPAVGMTLVLGILRKELALVLLYSALGTYNPASVLTPVQILTFTAFVALYVPCLSSLAVQVREIGWRWTLGSVLLNTAAALAAAGGIRLLAWAVRAVG